MEPSTHRSQFWFRASIGFGVLLGLVLLVQTVATYFFVYHRIIREEAVRVADQKNAALQRAARMANIREPRGLETVLTELVRESPGQLTWMRIVNASGATMAKAGQAPLERPARAELRQQLEAHETTVREVRSGSETVLVATSHLRMMRGPFGGAPPGASGTQPPPPVFLETGVNIDGISVPFGALRTNLIIGVSAAIALMAAMALIGILFGRYQRSKHLEHQMELARSVQNDLLPRPDSAVPRADRLEFAAVCLPAATVGGDFYDVFTAENGQLSVVLGDVAGKGLSAALLMGVIHGAIRSMDWTESVVQHETSSERLNRLLCQKTARERFASLFWAYISREDGKLRYINAGHLPPLLVRNAGSNAVERLDGGGPVLGMLPVARYRSGEADVGRGDLLVVFSDGIAEAMNTREEEFGDGRIAEIVQRLAHTSPRQICDAILAEVGAFLGVAKPHDDQTLLVVRLA